jgi:hypothetical protein
MIIYLYFHNITNFLDYIFMLFNFITQACDIISQNMGLVIDDHFSSIDILTVTFIMVRAIPPCPTWALIDCSINSHILFFILYFIFLFVRHLVCRLYFFGLSALVCVLPECVSHCYGPVSRCVCCLIWSQWLLYHGTAAD